MKKKKSKILIYTSVSIILHISIILLFINTEKKVKQIKKSKKFSIKLKKQKKKIKLKKKKKLDLKNKQIVDIQKPKIEREPDKAKYLAKHDNKTKKEKKAKKKNKIIKKVVNKKDTPIPKKKKVSINKHKKKLKKQKKKVENKKIENKLPIKKKAGLVQKQKKQEAKAKDIKLNISDLQFSKMLKSASNDYLKDVKDGDYTDLNTLAYEYSGYFIKIKNKVSKTWNPAAAYQKNDPYRKIYGIKDRYTILLITINKDGELKKIRIQKSSGLSFLDQEAILAFEKGAPYKIVPTGLLDGKEDFTIQFGFYVDNPSSPRIFYLR